MGCLRISVAFLGGVAGVLEEAWRIWVDRAVSRRKLLCESERDAWRRNVREADDAVLVAWDGVVEMSLDCAEYVALAPGISIPLDHNGIRRHVGASLPRRRTSTAPHSCRVPPAWSVTDRSGNAEILTLRAATATCRSDAVAIAS